MSEIPKFTILLVDDEPAYLEVAVMELADQFNMLTAGSVDEAIPILSQNNVDATLTDYRMSPKNGLALLQHMQETGHRALRILVTGNSKSALEENRRLGIRIDEVVEKPIDLEKTLPRILEKLADSGQGRE